MDKRKNPPAKDALLAQRIAFYDDIAAGRLSLQAAVKTMRAISGMTQPEFAANRGVSVRVIKEIESGKGNPTVRSLNQIGQIFALEVTFRRVPKGE